MPGRFVSEQGALSIVRSFAIIGLTAFWFQFLMHFSAYLMIAALVLMGLQLAWAFYQLASFVL
jgi:hypothetical protein